jgi:hypothetical protein
MPPRDDETNQDSDYEDTEGALRASNSPNDRGEHRAGDPPHGIGDTPACCLNGFRGFLNSFRGLSQQGWRISG